MVEEEDIDALKYHDLQARCRALGLSSKGKTDELKQRLKDYNELKTRCSALGLSTDGKPEELRQRLNDYNAPNAQTPRLSDIDEEDESESESDRTTPRRRTRGRSVDLNNRRLSGRTRSSSRDRRGSEIGRRRSSSVPKTPTPINDILLGNEDPFEGSPLRADEIEQRLRNVEGKQHSTDDKYGEVVKHQRDIQNQVFSAQNQVYNKLSSLEEFREYAKSKINELENEEELIKKYREQVNTYLKKHVNDTKASIVDVKSAFEAEIKSIKSESVKMSQTMAVEIKSFKDELSESIKSSNEEADVKLTATKRTMDDQFAEHNGKVETLGKEVAEVWDLVNEDIIDEMKMINQKLSAAVSEQSELKSELSKLKVELSELKSRNQNLVFMSILLLVVVVATDFFPFDAASAFDAVSTRFKLCWIWFQRGCFQTPH
eukprot:scaffold11018_cov127-Skeletonema_marinoi.AAC.8